MEAYQAQCLRVGLQLTRLLAASLGLPAEYFDAPGMFDKPQIFLRLLRYAPQPSRPADGVFAAGAHTDYGMVTLLATDDNPGLQVASAASRQLSKKRR